MSVDEGTRDAYLEELRRRLYETRSEADKLRARVEVARLQERALQGLTEAQKALLVGSLPSVDLAALQAEAQKLHDKREALVALIQAVRRLT